MTEQNQNEIWQVMIGEELHEADLETLKQWVINGQVQPEDMVRKGNLRWIEAHRAPALRSAFSGEPEPTPPPTPKLTLVYDSSANKQDAQPSEELFNPAYDFAQAHETERKITSKTECINHADVAPKYMCRSCYATFCKECTKFVSNIATCALCGDLCKPYEEVRKHVALSNFQQESFGIVDLGRALSYPFRDPWALIGSAILYSILLVAGRWRTGLVAHAIVFACMSLVIRQVSVGRFNRSFVPDFGAFSWYDDVVVPLKLSIGVTIISWGPLILLIISLVFGLISFTGSGMSYAQEQQIKMEQEREEFAEGYDAFINGGDPEKEKAFIEQAEALTPTGQMAQAHRLHEEEKMQATMEEIDPAFSTLKTVFAAALPIIALAALAILWGVFYYPIALTIAGYTQDFWSVLNPALGLDTARTMGLVYVKAFFMYIAISIIGAIFTTIVAIITAPFHMPFVGNMIANFINGMITFYTSLAIAFLLGLSLFKCADKLDIPVD
jgi:hypothetical protein